MGETLLVSYYALPAMLCLGLVVAARWLGRRRAALRHRLLVLGVAAAIAAPMLMVLMPAPLRWRMPVALADGQTTRSGATPTGILRGSPSAPVPVGAGSSGTPPTRSSASITPDRETGGAPSVAVAIVPWLVAISMLGSAVVCCRQLTSTIALRRLLRGAVASPSLAAETAILGPRVGLRRGVRVVIGEGIGVPLTWGTRRPAIAVPAGFDRWPSRRRRLALLHELAHVRRRDALALAVFRAAEAIYWWNPAIWWISELAGGDAEVASDRLVIDSGIRPVVYARELLATVRAFRAGTLPVLPLAGGLDLAERVEQVCRPDRAAGLPSRRTAWVAAALSVIVTAALAGARPADPRPGPEAGAGGGRPAAPGTLLEVRRAPVTAGAAIVVTVPEPPSDPDPRVRRRPLDPVRSSELARLERELAAADPLARERAVDAIGELDDPRVVPLLVLALGDASSHVRQSAADELGDLRAAQAVPALAIALGDPSKNVRQAAADSLGRIGPAAAEVLPALVAAASDVEDHVRQAAVEALGDVDAAAAEATLLAALEDPNPFVRQSALSSLVELRRSSSSGR